MGLSGLGDLVLTGRTVTHRDNVLEPPPELFQVDRIQILQGKVRPNGIHAAANIHTDCCGSQSLLHRDDRTNSCSVAPVHVRHDRDVLVDEGTATGALNDAVLEFWFGDSSALICGDGGKSDKFEG